MLLLSLLSGAFRPTFGIICYPALTSCQPSISSSATSTAILNHKVVNHVPSGSRLLILKEYLVLLLLMMMNFMKLLHIIHFDYYSYFH